MSVIGSRSMIGAGPGASGVLQALDVSVSYGSALALDRVSFEVHRGEAVAITGSSGSGKSTLLHCLSGLLRPEHGVVRVDGQDLGSLTDAQVSDLRLAKMGVIFQFGELLPELTVEDNVALPLWMTGGSRRAAASAAIPLLEAFGIGALADRLPGELSGGERQRAAVARALVHGPAFVLADEPTGSLDSANAEAVLDVLLDEVRARNAGLVLVTHERDAAAGCDRIVELKDGRLACSGR